MGPQSIVVSAVIMQDSSGRLLTVRKQGTSRFMLPGGKPEPGEDALTTAVREAAEELAVSLKPEQMRAWGVFTTLAANEAGTALVASVFEHPYVAGVHPCAEIAEARWEDLDADDAADLAPLTVEVMGLLRQRRPCGDAVPG
ncbi:NUDIX hydrolase [Actinomyces trachealis]|uniref:NUDIX hydrolase n=1 Tax=Actinomyces trachealis TaxID=2763540 RepID=UPI0018C52092|nr:NUDIX domain-containing protein [Actinomyces trachealis]